MLPVCIQRKPEKLPDVADVHGTEGGANIIPQDIRKRRLEHKCRRVDPDQAAHLSIAERFSLRARTFRQNGKATIGSGSSNS